MNYYFNKKITGITFDESINRVTEELTKEGFGVLTEIDVAATLKKKLDVDFRKYKILGACNPSAALEALEIEPKIGLMLPCNVVVEESLDGSIGISIINPVVAMQSVNNPKLTDFANDISNKLENVIRSL